MVDVVLEHRLHPVGVGVGDVVGVARVGDAVGVLLLFAIIACEKGSVPSMFSADSFINSM